MRETDDGFRLQSPEQKDWEKTRRGIEMKPGDAVRLRKRILKDALGSMTVSKGRTFKVELFAEREKMSDGDIALDVREDADIDGLRQTSRSEDAKSRIFWAYTTRRRHLGGVGRAASKLRDDRPVRQRESERCASECCWRRSASVATGRLKTAEQLLGRDITDGTDGLRRQHRRSARTAICGRGRPTRDRPARQDLPEPRHLRRLLQEGRRPPDPSGRHPRRAPGPVRARRARAVPDHRKSGASSSPTRADRDRRPPTSRPASSSARTRTAASSNATSVARRTARPSRRSRRCLPRRCEPGSSRSSRRPPASPRPPTGASSRSSATSRSSGLLRSVPPRTPAPSLEVRAEVSEWLSRHDRRTALARPARARCKPDGRAFGPLRQPCTEARSTLAGAGLAVPEVLDDDGRAPRPGDEHRRRAGRLHAARAACRP